MKTLMLICCLLALPALADIPLVENPDPQLKTYGLLKMLTGGSLSPEDIQEHLASHGYAIKDATALKVYIDQAEAEMAAVVAADVAGFCKNRASYSTPETLAQAIDLMLGHEQAIMRDRVEKLSTVISQSDIDAIQHFGESDMAPIHNMTVDFHAVLLQHPEGVQLQLDSWCDIANGKTEPPKITETVTKGEKP